MTESECVFCAIVDGASAHFVAETGLVIAFLDIAPMAPGHTLVVPRRHAPRLADLTADEMAALALIGQRIAIALGSEAHSCFSRTAQSRARRSTTCTSMSCLARRATVSR